MTTVFTSSRSPRSLLSASLLAAFSISAAGLCEMSAQSIDLPYPIGLEHAMAKPYNFTGRVFDTDEIGFGSGTLVRRHIALTAGHVVFTPGVGFSTSQTFTRALYQKYSMSKNQVAAVDALSGYQTEAVISQVTTAAFSRDLGLLVIKTPPVDEDWANYSGNVTNLTKTLSSPQGRFILGYPGVTFDGRTMTYIVPSTPFVEGGTQNSGYFTNEEITSEPGNSGGPIYIYNGSSAPADGKPVEYDASNYQVIAELTGGLDDPSGEFNFTIVRAINSEAAKFIAQEEYAQGLIRKASISGPKTVRRGTTVTYTVKPLFQIRTLGGQQASTDRYSELQLVSDVVNIPKNPSVIFKKVSNTEFQVTFTSQLRSGSQLTLQVQNAKNSLVPNSKRVVRIQ